MKNEKWLDHHLRLFMALYVSEGWYDTWFRNKSGSMLEQKFAIKARAKAAVLFDRTLNQELDRMGNK